MKTQISDSSQVVAQVINNTASSCDSCNCNRDFVREQWLVPLRFTLF